MKSENPSPQYWDQLFEKKKEDLRLSAWRKYMKSVYSRLMSTWFETQNGATTLKTDLFEEASSEHSLLSEFESGFGVDNSVHIALAARAMSPDQFCNRLIVCDLRNLPLRSESFHQILSGSSLDHFSLRTDIGKALKELSRVLIPGGILILTLDNPHNPAVWIRNALPFAWLNRIGLVPYYVGPTCRLNEARKLLENAGFEVMETTAVAHVPRAPAIWCVMVAEKLRTKKIGDWLSRHYESWETLQRFPFRYITGYYIALRARKLQDEPRRHEDAKSDKRG